VLTASGGRTSHASVVARQLGKVCLVGCTTLRLRPDATGCEIGGGQGWRVVDEPSWRRSSLRVTQLREREPQFAQLGRLTEDAIHMEWNVVFCCQALSPTRKQDDGSRR
jgi:phosphoenolpyruvate-protein kinase (PTS system EI component)